jgi:hypothetical protein
LNPANTRNHLQDALNDGLLTGDKGYTFAPCLVHCVVIRHGCFGERRRHQGHHDLRQRYNDERPHEGIDNQMPGSLWIPSFRAYPERITAPMYPAHLEVRRVSTAGTFRLHARQPFLSQALRNQHIGLEEVADGI